MKAKFKIKQLAAVDSRDIELVHPKHGETGIVVKLAGPLHPTWVEALAKFKDSKQETGDNLDLLAATILEWDEESFEAPLTVEAAKAALSADENRWMTSFLVEKTTSNDTFFQ